MIEAMAIRIEKMSKRYRSNTAVDRFTLDIPAGSVFGLLGENGAGKTTTIQVLLGLIVADEGRVETLGLDPAEQGLEVRRKVGYVPEQPCLYDWMTVGEIGWFAAGFHAHAREGTKPFEDHYKTLVTDFGLPIDRKVRHLSKGMRAKVSLALALASEPRLLILDEPTSGLDVLVRREFLESMVELAGAGRTVLLSSHQIAEVERVASHVALLHKGRLILAEPLDELLARTFRLTLTLSNRDRSIPFPAGLGLEPIDIEETPRQARWLVHAPEPAAVERVRALPGVATLEVERPSLEDIYIGYMRARRGSTEPVPPVAMHVA
jgi:ABC-2 type transport system ATP-binding protein